MSLGLLRVLAEQALDLDTDFFPPSLPPHHLVPCDLEEATGPHPTPKGAEALTPKLQPLSLALGTESIGRPAPPEVKERMRMQERLIESSSDFAHN